MRAKLPNSDTGHLVAGYWLLVTGIRDQGPGTRVTPLGRELARLWPCSVQDADCHSYAFFSNLNRAAGELTGGEAAGKSEIANLLSDIICPVPCALRSALCALRPAPCASYPLPHTPYPK
jgi:hypothetical protein